jgi:hypothetical protein
MRAEIDPECPIRLPCAPRRAGTRELQYSSAGHHQRFEGNSSSLNGSYRALARTSDRTFAGTSSALGQAGMAGKSGRSGPESSINGSIPTAHWISCKLTGRKRPGFAGPLQSPLTDSNRRPPPYHAIQTATGGSRWQRFSASSSHFPAFGPPNLCHRLRPLCSITVPCQSAENGPFERPPVAERGG